MRCPVCDQFHTSDPYDSHDVRGLPCQQCGKSITFPVTYQGAGCFCSWDCANAFLRTRDANQCKAS